MRWSFFVLGGAKEKDKVQISLITSQLLKIELLEFIGVFL